MIAYPIDLYENGYDRVCLLDDDENLKIQHDCIKKWELKINIDKNSLTFLQ